jgi:lysyl-tRNA synthetase class II
VLTEERWEASFCGIFPHLKRVVPAQKGRKMTAAEIRALKAELKRLNAELEGLKGELLADRTRELDQIIRDQARKAHSRVNDKTTSVRRVVH